MRATCIITFRSTSAARVRNLNYVLRWLEGIHDVETVVVEQDAHPTLNAIDAPARCRVLFARNTGRFNKSWGFNLGFQAANSDVLVFADADLLVNHQQLSDALDACARASDVVRPWSDIVDLTEGETASLMAGSLDAASVSWPDRRGPSRGGEQPPLCGGLYVIRREVYARLGGQDERFRGWGGEDDAMSIKVASLCSRIAVARNSVAFHLHHPRHASLPIDDRDYRNNVALLEEYRTLSRDALAQLCAAQQRTMGLAGPG